MKKLLALSLFVFILAFCITYTKKPFQETLYGIKAKKDAIEIKPITLELIFSDSGVNSQIPPDDTITLIATGDILLARSINAKNVSTQNFNWPFEKVASTLKNADITFVNLETPIVKNCPLTHTGMVFCGTLRNTEGLKFAAIDVVNISNNHMLDQGVEGHNETYKHLIDNGFLVSGFNGPVYHSVKGSKFSFLGYNEVIFNDHVYKETLDKISKEIKTAKQNSDVVVVQFHWGNEYTTKITKRQRVLAHHAIDNGADLIIGNHAHWIQPIEIYKGKLITYAHGNFIMDQEWSLKTKQGVIGKYTFYKDQLVDVEFLPILIENFGQPSLLEGEERNQILNEMRDESLKLSNSN